MRSPTDTRVNREVCFEEAPRHSTVKRRGKEKGVAQETEKEPPDW